MISPLPTPAHPLRLALIGAGERARTVYQLLGVSRKPWCVPVAVCDPRDVEALLAVSFPRS